MHAIIAAIVAVLLCVLLFSILRKRRAEIGNGLVQKTALALALAGLVLIVLGWIGVVILTWAPWLVWASVVLYLAATVARAVNRR